ncbi:MAG: protein-tyrosine phosphatase family protein [Chlamydiales bacterium]
MKIFVESIKHFPFVSFLIILNSMVLFGAAEELSFSEQEYNNSFYKYLSHEFKNLQHAKNPLFKPNRLFLVDHTENNFLFRGNVPINNETFAYEELIETIKKSAADNNLDLKDDFKLTVISLLNSFTESETKKIEKNFFMQYPEKGRVYFHAIYGDLLNPCLKKDLNSYFIIDRIPELMTRIHDRMTKNSPRQHVIYVHCWSGRDRTGEVSGCYLMEYNNKSYKSVMKTNETIAKRKLRPFSINAIRLYGLYLRDVKKIPSVGTICE